MKLGISLTPKFKKFGFLVGFAISYLFVKLIKKQIPITISFYILARIGVIYIAKLQKKGFIPKEFPIMKIIFIFLLTVLNYYLVNYPEFLSKKMIKNYRNFGNFDDKSWLDLRTTIPKPQTPVE